MVQHRHWETDLSLGLGRVELEGDVPHTAHTEVKNNPLATLEKLVFLL